MDFHQRLYNFLQGFPEPPEGKIRTQVYSPDRVLHKCVLVLHNYLALGRVEHRPVSPVGQVKHLGSGFKIRGSRGHNTHLTIIDSDSLREGHIAHLEGVGFITEPLHPAQDHELGLCNALRTEHYTNLANLPILPTRQPCQLANLANIAKDLQFAA